MNVIRNATRLQARYYEQLEIPLSESEYPIIDTTLLHSRRFFGASRLSAEPDVQRFNTLRRIISECRFSSPEQTEKYRSWERIFHGNIQLVRDLVSNTVELRPVTTATIAELASKAEPSVLIVRTLERIRTEDFSGFEHEPAQMMSAYNAYETFIASIQHARTLTGVVTRHKQNLLT